VRVGSRRRSRSRTCQAGSSPVLSRRTANALDPATRTLLVEVQVPNSTGALMPGEYAQVDLAGLPRQDPPLLIRATLS